MLKNVIASIMPAVVLVACSTLQADPLDPAPKAASRAAGDAAFPVKPSTNGRYLLDQKNRPFLIHGDTAWSVIFQVTREDAEFYLEDRRRKGFNAIVVNLITHDRGKGITDDTPNNVFGDGPFTTPRDFSTPNEAYFAHADWVLRKAAEKGIIVFLNPCWMGWSRTPDGPSADGVWEDIVANGPAKCRDYGRYLGDRYKDFTNIIWGHGGDRMPPADHAGTLSALEVLFGIRDKAPSQLHTAHWSPKSWNSLAMPTFAPHLDLVGLYHPRTAQPYDAGLQVYNLSPPRPVFLYETRYEGPIRHYAPRTPEWLRAQAYWTNLSGSTGQVFGSHFVWSFGFDWSPFLFSPDWRAGLDETGSWDMMRLRQAFQGRPWHTLVPDQKHVLVTAGYGTFGSGDFDSEDTGDYVTAARSADGKLAMAYLPSTGTGTRKITLDMGKLSGTATARWYNPTNGKYLAISGSPFANSGSWNFVTPGDNGTGTNDWLLVVEASGRHPDWPGRKESGFPDRKRAERDASKSKPE